ncbi:elongation factor 1-gamma [Pisolithus croceorrhizus]|nr:elongation factor 1-gamma [Pisolithus croceorrhizus]
MTWNGYARQKTIVPCPFSLDSHSRAQKMAAIGKLLPSLAWVRSLSYFKATAAVAGVGLEEPVYKHYEDDEMPEFLAKFPYGRIPAFEGAEGFNLTEGAAIARYVPSVAPNSGLPGDMVVGTTLIDQYSIREFSTPQAVLLIRTCLVDERLTLADIALLLYPNVLPHLDLIIDQPKLKDVFGRPTFVKKAVRHTPPEKEKKEKEPKQPAPVPVPKKEKPKKAEEDDEGDENPNPKTPLISYQNRRPVSRTGNALIPTTTCAGPAALERFCENLDKGGFSISIALTSNTMKRWPSSSCPPARLVVSSTVWRLHMSKPVVEIASNYESYDYKKLDMENSEDKAFLGVL